MINNIFAQYVLLAVAAGWIINIKLGGLAYVLWFCYISSGAIYISSNRGRLAWGCANLLKFRLLYWPKILIGTK